MFKIVCISACMTQGFPNTCQCNNVRVNVIMYVVRNICKSYKKNA